MTLPVRQSEAPARSDGRTGEVRTGPRALPIEQKDVFDAAAKLFREKGYQNTTMKDIADQLGITKPTLYARTKSKLEILEGIFTHVLESAEKKVQEANELATPLERVTMIVHFWTKNAVELQAQQHVFMGDERELPPRLMRYYRRWSSECQVALRDWIAEGQRTGVFRKSLDPVVTSFAIIAMTTWTARWYRDDGPLTPDAIADSYCDLVLPGLLAEGAAGD